MSNMMKTDLRIIKTKKAIRSAFADLVSRKPIEEITVTDIASQAMINRKTFYAHYTGVHEVVSEIEDEIVESVRGLLAQKSFEEILGCPHDLFDDVMQIVNSDLDAYGRLLTVSGNSNLVQKIIQMLRREICDAYVEEAHIDRETLDMIVYFMLSGMLAVFTEWYNTGRKQPIGDLSVKLSHLCFDGVHGMMKQGQEEE